MAAYGDENAYRAFRDHQPTGKTALAVVPASSLDCHAASTVFAQTANQRSATSKPARRPLTVIAIGEKSSSPSDASSCTPSKAERERRRTDMERQEMHDRFEREIQAVEERLAQKEVDKARGRKPRPSSGASQRAGDLMSARLALLEDDGQDDVETDGIDVYIRYAKWTLTAYPIAGEEHDAHVLPILERLVRRFYSVPKYQTDARYLRFWLLFAQYLPATSLSSTSTSPRMAVYALLLLARIGHLHSHLYEELASFLECQAQHDQAETAYKLGLSRKAEPIARLKKKYKAFLARRAEQLETEQRERDEGKRLAVFCDDTQVAGSDRHPLRVISVLNGVEHLDKLEQLRQQPLKNFELRLLPTALLEPIDVAILLSGRGHAPSQTNGQQRPIVNLSTPLHLLYPPDSTAEQSLEELMASRYNLQLAALPDWAIGTALSVDAYGEPLAPAVVSTASSPTKPSVQFNVYQDDEPEVVFHASPMLARRPPSPTMNTRAALNEVDAMFSATLNLNARGRERMPSAESQDTSRSCSEPGPEPSQYSASGSARDTGSDDVQSDDELATRLATQPSQFASQLSQSFSQPGLPFGFSQSQTVIPSQDSERYSDDEDAETGVLRPSPTGVAFAEDDAGLFVSTQTDTRARHRQTERFGQAFDAMTPITERTCENGNTTRGALSFMSLPASVALSEGTEQSRTSENNTDEVNGNTFKFCKSVPVHSRKSELGHRKRSMASAPCDPFDAAIVAHLLTQSEHLASVSFIDMRNRTAQQLTALNKMASVQVQSSRKSSSSASGKDSDPWELELGNDVFSVRAKLGEGGFGAVFAVWKQVKLSPDESNAFSDDDDDDSDQLAALKVEGRVNLWEFHVMHQLHQRLAVYARNWFVRCHELYAFKDESFLLLDFCPQGSLFHAIKSAQSNGIASAAGASGIDEMVALFFIIEMIKIVEAIHASGFIHCDVKAENCMIRLEEVPGGSRAWSSKYSRSGEGGWNFKGLRMVDFGRMIDMSAFPSEQQFLVEWTETPDQHDCLEMRNGKSWTYEPDYYGLASIAHLCLFGRFIETTTDEDGQQCLTQGFRRYHQVDLWTRFFGLMLNPGLALPITDRLRELRCEMEDWLEANCDKGSGLKTMLKRLEAYTDSAANCR
ncbi:uncharacterized protein L969DRAFT_105403 [Mixia osmundae IAM 14324]|uniref:Protein kinase domain-containing protein n=1 Tax=Mixia osmundae (strain CBS 9802 / IAM 14324 / JCM 22182 / KY 12970) TaxID=764103 RepID=G7DZG7_MIXOS|nr:uncharacterized protein L969DRAFT_105403 [Mixia osmundae IAM 14324]KEI37148.1 hypothetical protein L969DRAFT_105403 [Mixia osmundae IAM 14324]GAA95977.1 hypothetical protein E5Q_02635 [Mixia osmundae IAM 14324]